MNIDLKYESQLAFAGCFLFSKAKFGYDFKCWKNIVKCKKYPKKLSVLMIYVLLSILACVGCMMLFYIEDYTCKARIIERIRIFYTNVYYRLKWKYVSNNSSLLNDLKILNKKYKPLFKKVDQVEFVFNFRHKNPFEYKNSDGIEQIKKTMMQNRLMFDQIFELVNYNRKLHAEYMQECDRILDKNKNHNWKNDRLKYVENRLFSRRCLQPIIDISLIIVNEFVSPISEILYSKEYEYDMDQSLWYKHAAEEDSIILVLLELQKMPPIPANVQKKFAFNDLFRIPIPEKQGVFA